MDYEFGFTPDDLPGWNPEDGDTCVTVDGIHRQHLPMTRRFGGYPKSFRGECRDRTGKLPVMFPLGIGIDRFSVGRQIDMTSAERALVEMLEEAAVNAVPAAACEPKFLRLIVDRIAVGIFDGGKYDELHDRISQLWKKEELRRAIVLAYRAARTGLAAVAASKNVAAPPLPLLPNLVN